MRRFSGLLGLSILLTIAACGQSGRVAGTGGSPDRSREAFDHRAAEIADAWRAGPDRSTWQTGYVPLQDATVLPAGVTFGADLKQAILAGWYRAQVALPGTTPAHGTIRFPDGTLTVPLISAAEAYRQIDRGDPPPCPGRPAPQQPVSPAAPDGSVSSSAPVACVPLTVTAARLGTVPVRTSRGEAQVPAWLFTVDQLAAPVARLAVAPVAVGAVPSPSTSALPPAELVSAEDLIAVDGAKLTYRLGVGSCDTDIIALVGERTDVVVVGGRVTRPTGVCTAVLLLHSVTVTLDAPLGARPVLDAITGRPLLLAPR